MTIDNYASHRVAAAKRRPRVFVTPPADFLIAISGIVFDNPNLGPSGLAVRLGRRSLVHFLASARVFHFGRLFDVEPGSVDFAVDRRRWL